MIWIFKSVLAMSAAGTVLIILLLSISVAVKKAFSAKQLCCVWVTVLILMVLPLWGMLPRGQAAVRSAARRSVSSDETMHSFEVSVSEVSENPAPDTPQMNAVQADIPQAENITVAEAEGKHFNISIYTLFAGVWLFGVFIFLLCAAVSYIRFLLNMRASSVSAENNAALLTARQKLGIRRNIRLRITKNISSPMLVGILFPVIYIPRSDIDDDAMTMIFLHELTHYKRRDLLLKWFSMIVNAVHWFNPTVYIAARELGKACELSCDESVTKNMSSEDKRLYMQTIVQMVAKRKGDTHYV